ncbi:MAG: SAM-dependent methyltransferase, partial [Rickettsia endosymbiont of Ixodes persulcatus]|nr:SAM-dependent methyltransferase [Rickettsia endosymbiont of Ixodes persulcatus]
MASSYSYDLRMKLFKALDDVLSIVKACLAMFYYVIRFRFLLKNHKYCPILENLGEADLSAHVDFYTLKTVAKNRKINVIDTILQRDF